MSNRLTLTFASRKQLAGCVGTDRRFESLVCSLATVTLVLMCQTAIRFDQSCQTIKNFVALEQNSSSDMASHHLSARIERRSRPISTLLLRKTRRMSIERRIKNSFPYLPHFPRPPPPPLPPSRLWTALHSRLISPTAHRRRNALVNALIRIFFRAMRMLVVKAGNLEELQRDDGSVEE